MDDRESLFKPYSIGIVVEDKLRGSNQIKVYPVETLPFIDGKISDFKPTFKASGVDSRGVEKQTNLSGDGIIVAEWFPDGHDNRTTSPDVIKNESVRIYRYADTDKYYWKTVYREPSLRRQETVNYMYGNRPDGMEAMDKDTSYWYEISTHDKYIKLHTSNNDGEPFAYDISLDTEKGNFLFTDNAGNSVEINSKTSYIGLKNGQGSEFLMDGQNLTINVPGTYTVNAGHYVNNSRTDHNEVVNLNSGYNASGDSGEGNSAFTEGNFLIKGNVIVNGTIMSTSTIDADGTVTAPDFVKK